MRLARNLPSPSSPSLGDAAPLGAPQLRPDVHAPAATQLADPPRPALHPHAHGVLHARLEAARDVLLGLVSPGALAAVALGLSGCASTTSPSGGVRGGALGDLGGRHPPPMDQLAYPEVQLGEGHYTIQSSGCLLTSLTMASAWLHGRTDLDPPRANRLVLANDGFSGSGLELSRAAPALGLRVERREAIGANNRVSLSRALELSLGTGRPVVLGVDFQPGSSSQASAADHFILAFRANGGGSYAAMDPAGGRQVELVTAADGSLGYRGAEDRHITEMIFLSSAPFAHAPAAVLARR